MQTKLIKTYQELRQFSDHWNPLLESSSANNLFLTWEWIDAWLNSNPRNTLYVVTVYSDNHELIGIAPFYIGQCRLLEIVQQRTLRMIGDTESAAEYPSIIARSECEQLVCRAITARLKADRKHWDTIWLPRCASWDPNINTFTKALADTGGIGCYTRKIAFSAFELPATYDDYLAEFSRNRRNSLRRIEKKVESIGNLEIHTCQTQSEVEKYLSALYRLHQKRWMEKGESGSFANRPALRRFYAQFVPRALHNGWLRFTMLTHKAEPKAIQIGYCYNGSYHQIQEGFDPEFHENVGNYLRIKTIRNFIDEGIKCYDFLGGESEHKRRWKAVVRDGFDLFAWNHKLKNLPFSYKPIWPTGRFLKQILP